ncbi:MAG: hypothetical protein ACP5N3_06560 [Candidatus Nanoarchaeia archaeon]
MNELLRAYRKDGNKVEIDLGRVVVRYENDHVSGIFYRDHGEHHVTPAKDLYELANEFYTKRDVFERKQIWTHENIGNILNSEGGRVSPSSDYADKTKKVMNYVKNNFDTLGLR